MNEPRVANFLSPALSAYHHGLLAMAVLCFSSATAGGRDLSTAEQKLLDGALAARARNYELLGSIEIKVEFRVFTDHSIGSGREPLNEKGGLSLTPIHGSATVPSIQIDYTAILHDGKAYIASRDRNGPLDDWLIAGDTTYQRDHHGDKLIIHKSGTTTLGGQLQVDPRNAGLTSAASSFDALLGRDAVESVRETVAAEIGPTIEIEAHDSLDGEASLFLAPSLNFLPVRVIWHGENGTIRRFADVKYQEVRRKNGTAYVYEGATIKSSFPHQNTSLDAPRWGQRIIYAVTSIDISPHMDLALFEPPSPPPGTRVIDVSGEEAVGHIVGEQANARWNVLAVYCALGIIGAMALLTGLYIACVKRVHQ